MPGSVRQEEKGTSYEPGAWPSNDKRNATVSVGRSPFPEGTVAHIFKPARSAMTSGRARTQTWRLVFERRTAPSIEPLMGWTGGDDPLTQVGLEFQTIESAIQYAERQGLRYTVQSANASAPDH